MRATAGDVADKPGAYRCLCCGQRTFVSGHDVFERCKSCECSIFEPDWRFSDWRYSEYPADQNSDIMAREVVD
jgi:hypothetical protein